MLQLENLTPFAVKMALFPDEEGVDTLYLMVKACFDIGQQWTLCDKQNAPVEADIYWDNPENSSLKYASDYHIGKPNSDIIMNGLACAPGKESVTQLNVSLRVGSMFKAITVYGDRQWLNGNITSPKPFQTMPMKYEYAFGGMHVQDGVIESSEQRNPLGRGYAGSRSVREMEGKFLPNLEDPAQLIQKHNDLPTPACFGYVSPAWQPRSTYTGTYDKQWQNQRAPYLPVDFDKRFMNMAHPDLIYPGYLQGGEPVSITGMHPAGPLDFTLPTIALASEIDINGQVRNSEFNLETLILEPNQLQLSMLWRSAIRCDKSILKVRSVTIKQNYTGTWNSRTHGNEALKA